ncbi:MAG: TVP38/TMEM64 family protein [Xenococcaceae cyanobacterium]
MINKTIIKWILIAVGVFSLIVVANSLGITEKINNILQSAIDWVDRLGTVGFLVFIAIYILATIFLLSGAVLTLGAGTIFGVVKGSILVSVASTLAATVAFLIGRYLARDWVAKQIENQPKFKAIDAATEREGWKIVGLTRLSPVFPFVFLNYAFGLTKVSLQDYVIASWIGMMPGTIMYVYLGSIGKAASGGGKTPAEWALFVVGLLATVAVTVYVTKIAQKALNSEIKISKDTNINSDLISEDRAI